MPDQRDFDVVVIGNAGVDTNVYVPGADVDLKVESNFTENIDCVGQAGGFSSRGYAQLGKRTAFIGYLGQDATGGLIREEFARDGIDTSGTFIDPAGTCRSINLMFRDGRRKNFYDGKSHMTLKPGLSVCESILARCRLAHFHIPNWARTLLPMARKHSVTIACDIQDVVKLDDPYRREFLEFADIVFLSAVNRADPVDWVRELLESKPSRIVVVGMGAQGCMVGSQRGIRRFPPVQLDVPVIDTNGAGDSLAVGLLSSLVLDGYELGDAALRGQIAARWKCGQRASSSNLIRREALDIWFKRLEPAVAT